MQNGDDRAGKEKETQSLSAAIEIKVEGYGLFE
jgi:hypothetical protein